MLVVGDWWVEHDQHGLEEVVVDADNLVDVGDNEVVLHFGSEGVRLHLGSVEVVEMDHWGRGMEEDGCSGDVEIGIQHMDWGSLCSEDWACWGGEMASLEVWSCYHLVWTSLGCSWLLVCCPQPSSCPPTCQYLKISFPQDQRFEAWVKAQE